MALRTAERGLQPIAESCEKKGGLQPITESCAPGTARSIRRLPSFQFPGAFPHHFLHFLDFTVDDGKYPSFIFFVSFFQH